MIKNHYNFFIVKRRVPKVTQLILVFRICYSTLISNVIMYIPRRQMKLVFNCILITNFAVTHLLFRSIVNGTGYLLQVIFYVVVPYNGVFPRR